MTDKEIKALFPITGKVSFWELLTGERNNFSKCYGAKLLRRLIKKQFGDSIKNLSVSWGFTNGNICFDPNWQHQKIYISFTSDKDVTKANIFNRKFKFELNEIF